MTNVVKLHQQPIEQLLEHLVKEQDKIQSLVIGIFNKDETMTLAVSGADLGDVALTQAMCQTEITARLTGMYDDFDEE